MKVALSGTVRIDGNDTPPVRNVLAYVCGMTASDDNDIPA